MLDGLVPGLTIYGIVWVLTQAYRASLNHQRIMKALQLKTEMNSRLIERVGSDPAIVDLLKADAQQQLFDVKVSDPALRMPLPHGRVLTSMQISAMLISAGVACLILRRLMPYQGDREGFLVFGVMGVALGIGALLSGVAALVAYRLWHTMKLEHA